MEYLEVFHMDLGQATYETVGWRHDDVIKWKHFRITGPLWGEFTGDRWIPLTTASDAELWHFFDLCLNRRLSKQSRRWWFEKQSRPLWCTLMKLWRLWNGVLQKSTSIFMIYMLKYIYIYISNSLWPCDTMWRHRLGSTVAHLKDCCHSTKPLPEPVLTYHHQGFIITSI